MNVLEFPIDSRAAGAASFSVKCVPPVSQKVREVPSPDIPVENNPRLQTSAPAAAAASSEAVSGVTRGKFTVYCEDKGESDGGLTGVRELDYKESIDVLSGDWWENVLGTRSGGMSWYSYQDLTAINGNMSSGYGMVMFERTSTAASGSWPGGKCKF